MFFAFSPVMLCHTTTCGYAILHSLPCQGDGQKDKLYFKTVLIRISSQTSFHISKGKLSLGGGGALRLNCFKGILQINQHCPLKTSTRFKYP